MKARGKIIGHIVVDLIQQQEIAAGAEFSIPLAQLRQTIRWPVRKGDLAWVKEPWCMLMPHAHVVPGHFVNLAKAQLPEHIRTRGYKLEFHPDGHGLRRKESRFTVEIIGHRAGVVKMLVHGQQIDRLVAERRAAK